MDNLVFTGMRIRNTTADGINFHDGVTNSKVTNSDLRNLGDDGLATWADTNADANDSFDHDTVQYPILANGIAIYGGHDNFVTDNRVIDAGLTQGGGIHVAQRFASTTLGRTDVLRNTLIRDGSLDPNWQFGVGALWFDARDGVMNGPDERRQHPHPAEPVRGDPVRLRLEHQQRQDQQRHDPEHRYVGASRSRSAARRRITNSTATGIQAADPDLQLRCRVHPHRRRRQLRHPQPDRLHEQLRADVPAVPAGQRLADLDQPDRGRLRLGRDRCHQRRAGGHGHQQRYRGGPGHRRSRSPVTSARRTPVAAASPPAHPARSASSSRRPRPDRVPATSPLPPPASPTPCRCRAPVWHRDRSSTRARPAWRSHPPSSATRRRRRRSTVTNTGTTSATISAISASGDFSQTNNCSTLAVGASCTVTAKFTPTASGARTGAVTITSNANNSPTTIALSGSGIGTNTNIALGQPASASSSVNCTQVARQPLPTATRVPTGRAPTVPSRSGSRSTWVARTASARSR